MRNVILKLAAVSGIALSAVACGGGSVYSATGTGTTGTGSGTGTGTTTTPLALTVDFTSGLSSIAAGGSTGLQVQVLNGSTLYTGGPATVSFSSNCIGAGTSTVDTNPASSATGIVSANYLANGCGGVGASAVNDTITATVSVGGQTLTDSVVIAVQPSTLGGLVFVSASPEDIGLPESGLPQSSVVTFKVTDSAGSGLPNVDVTFAPTTSVGGITLNTTSAKSNSSGLVQVTVTSGSVHTAVRVNASAVSGTTTIRSQSELIVIGTGIPDNNSFTLAVECQNQEALDIAGVPVTVTAFAADRFNNPVPDGTAISFDTEGGVIEAGCATVNGTCQVTWTSQNPIPRKYNDNDNTGRAGRSVIRATALGEESFTDANGNGRFDSGELFGDLAEAFLDLDEDGVRDSGEAFTDADGDGEYDFGETFTDAAPLNTVFDPLEPFLDLNSDGLYSPKSGSFTGVLCNSGCDTVRNIHVRATNVIIMSASTPLLSTTDVTGTGWNSVDTFTIPRNSAGVISVVVRDRNDQPMPNGTTISFSGGGSAGGFDGTSSFSVPCTTDDTVLGNRYSFTFKTADVVAGTSGIIILSVNTQGANGRAGIETIYQFRVVVS